MTDDRRWRVTRFDLWTNLAFDDRIRAVPAIDFRIAPRNGDDERAWALLADTHVYQISAAKDELPRRFHARAPLLARCPELLIVSSSGAGYDTVDVADCTAAGIAVVNQAGGNADSVAELAIGLLLAVARRIVESDKALRTRTGFSRESLMGRELRGLTIGVVGIGETGRRVAALAHAFGMKVLACDPYVAPEEIRRRGGEPVTLDALVAQSDVVSLHCPRDASTMGMFGAERYAAMRKGAILVSTARGGIHDEHALADALRCGHLGGAGLDVWEPEPPPLDHPLLALDNVVCTFHTAGVTNEARRNIAPIAAEQVIAALDGQTPPRLINPQVWPSVAAKIRARLQAG